MDIPVIKTERLLLRPFTAEDTPILNGILQEEDILRYFPSASPPSLGETQRSIARRNEHWAERGYGRWAVIAPGSALPVGWCGMDHFEDFGAAELTYLLSTRTWGRGFATEAARAAVHFGFETVGLEYIIASVDPKNAASIRVIEKCGMVYFRTFLEEGTPRLLYRLQNPGASTAAGMPTRRA